MDFNLPKSFLDYLLELDDFIEREIKPLEQQDDNIRFFDHRCEGARTDWHRGGIVLREICPLPKSRKDLLLIYLPVFRLNLQP